MEVLDAVSVGMRVIELLASILIGLVKVVIEGVRCCVCLLAHLVLIDCWEVDLSLTSTC